MSLLLETIRCENGELQNLPFHQARMNASVKILFETENRIRLAEIAVPALNPQGLYKCRVVYGKSIESVEFQPYRLPDIRSLQLVTDDHIEYSFKYADRSSLRKLLENKGDCDEILIVKNGLVTDTSFSNIIFFDGDKWLTPARPLLRGTQREKLLTGKKVFPAEIRPADLLQFQQARLINSMIRFEDSCVIERYALESSCH